MKTIRQLTRQPLKTMAGVVLIALAVAVLCISLGQSLAASKMERELENRFVTTALLTDKYQYYEETYYNEETQIEGVRKTVNMEKPEEVTDFLLSLAEDYPEIVTAIEQPGLATAYVPTMTADNYTKYISSSVNTLDLSDLSAYFLNGALDADPYNAPYTQVIAKITLTDLYSYDTAVPEGYFYHWTVEGTAGTEALKTVNSRILDESGSVDPEKLDRLGLEAVTINLVGTIEEVLGLQEGYADPTGFTARMKLILPSLEAFEALDLQIGETYLVYGMNYVDLDYNLRNRVFTEGYGIQSIEFGDGHDPFEIEAFDPDGLHLYSEEDLKNRYWWQMQENGGQLPDYYDAGYYLHKVEREDGSTETRCITLDNSDMEEYRSVSFSIFDLSQLSGEVDERCTVPTITKIDGDVDKFLASEEGSLWYDTLADMTVSNHSFAVLGVDNLNAVACFADQSAWVSQGRSFNDQEIASGAKVCVISEYLAEMNGLSVGDTIPMRYFSYDWDSPYQNFLSDGYGVTNPGGYFYSSDAGFAGEAEEYTIVGLYGKDYLWPNAAGTLCGITPNTIFVPKSSVTGDMDYAEQGLFLSLVIENGKQAEFEKLIRTLGEDGLFTVDDQGYSEVKDSLHDYQAVAKQAMTVGAVVYGVILLLFLVLFPAMQGKVLTTMGSLGATRVEKLKHMAVSSLGILVPGTALGLMAGCLLWQRVVSELLSSARVVLELELDVGMLALVALSQLLAAFLLAFLVSLPMTRQRGMADAVGRVKAFFLRLKRTPLNGWNITLFAVVVALALCGLNAANEAELADYEVAYQNTPVKVTLMTAKTQNAYNLNASGFVTDLFTDERFARFTPLKYVEDVQFMCSLTSEYINTKLDSTQLKFSGMTSGAEPPDLSNTREAFIMWEDGYDYWVFDEKEQMYLLWPEKLPLEDCDPDTPGTQILIGFSNSVFIGYNTDGWGYTYGEAMYEMKTCEVEATIAGYYTNSLNSQTVYCSFTPLQAAGTAVGQSLPLDYISATLINNDEAADLREMANQWFADPGDLDTIASGAYAKDYALAIDTGVLDNLKATMENSMTVNRVCTLLVFLLSTGAGFFLGFLMIRSRKREIILMRTLGKPNGHIFRDFVWEQMRYILLGAVLGGGVFLWKPVTRLGLFALLYFVGLGIALVIFLNSKLLTTIKEEE